MSLVELRVSDFRCLRQVELRPDPRCNLIIGANASGKTTLLEAIYYLGRGRSFRAAGNRELIRNGANRFQLFAESCDGNGITHRSGIEASAGERQIRVDGRAGTAADLAGVLPVQAIDPDIHEFVQGPPENRRRLLDWGVFHVKHGFLDDWRRYHRALQQRNAALRGGEPDSRLAAWEAELGVAGEAVHQHRADFIARFMPLFSSITRENLLIDAICGYKRGWPDNLSLLETLAEGRERDRSMGTTLVGPHRADLALAVQQRRARHRVSRGQQKLLAAGLVLAQCRLVAEHIHQPLVLLVDDPAAELDHDNRQRLLQELRRVPAQLFITALEPGDIDWPEAATTTVIEHGNPRALL